MSSGEKAKPPATFEERNPFDISRRSGPEVAAEITKRMVAWKQAHARTSATPTTIPSGDAKFRSGDAKAPPIAAPVQPARMPKSTAPAPQPAPTAATRSATSSTLRVPYFASASATRRAMPPAPSLKQSSVRPQASTGDELTQRADEPTIPIVAPVLEQASPRHDESRLDETDAVAVATPETPLADAPPVAAASIEEIPPEEIPPEEIPLEEIPLEEIPPEEIPLEEISLEEIPLEEIPLGADAAPAAAPSKLPEPAESPSVAVASDPIAVEPDDNERRRAEARAIKARWMAAHDLDALIDASGAGSDAGRAPTVEAVLAAVHETGSGEGRDTSAPERPAAAADLDYPLPVEKPDDVACRDESTIEEPIELERDATLEAAATVDEPAPESPAAVRTVPADVSDEASERMEPAFGVSIARATPAPVVDRDVAKEASAVDLAALDEMAGRKEPTFDAPIARATPEVAADAHPGTAAQGAAAEPATVADRNAADEGPSLAALDDAAGRKEPTFDKPIRREVLEIEPPVHAAMPAREVETPMETASDVTPEDTAAPVEPLQLSIATLDEVAGRKEPTFDEPARPADAKPAAAHTAAPRITLRPIETRIEARRVDTLRADPQLSARRPIFPHIEPNEWDMPPVVAAHARRERRGTGWAIGLGSVLMIAGITAPAAIWQQGRQMEDPVALANPAPATQQVQTSAPTATTTAQATLPEAPQPETPPPAPAVTAQESSVLSQATPKSEAGQAAPNPKPATTLGAVSDGGDVDEAPVVAPPSPTVNLASKADTSAEGTPMVARPFVPEQGDGPFLQAPTTGATTVPVAGAPVQSAAVGVRPNLMGQLKPKAAAAVSATKPVASKPQPVVRKPKPFLQQSPDQMFETLIETLSEGKPVNPRTKPASPSNRR